jgi:hypothetical protein
MHEQEWRVQADSYPATAAAGLLGVLVGHPAWTPVRWLQAPTGRLLDSSGNPTDDPRIGVHPEIRTGWYSPPCGFLRRYTISPGVVGLQELPPWSPPSPW